MRNNHSDLPLNPFFSFNTVTSDVCVCGLYLDRVIPDASLESIKENYHIV